MTTLYEKRGRRYHPIAESETYNALPAGAHLVIVKPGSTSMRSNVDPDNARVLAVIGTHREKLHDAMRSASMQTYGARETTPLEREAFRAYCDVMGREAMLSLSSASAYDIVDALERAILEAAS